MVETAVGAVASVAGGLISSSGASDAADTQAAGARDAAAVQDRMFRQVREDLLPYMQAGYSGIDQLRRLTGIDGHSNDVLKSDLLKPIVMDQATLEQTPGYQFNLAQGLRAVQNSAAARGLGTSGAALKGAANFATGLADSTYQNQFANAVLNQTNQFNRLMGISQLGQNSAAQVGNYGTQAGAGIAQTLASGANAQAASQLAGSQALASIPSGIYGAVYDFGFGR